MDQLEKKLASLEQQRTQLAAALAQLNGAIGFCKGLIAEAKANETEGTEAVSHPSYGGTMPMADCGACDTEPVRGG